MPNYTWDIEIPAGTTEKTPVRQKLKMVSGVIVTAKAKFAFGCHRLVKVRLLRSTFQVSPRSGGDWWTGDGETVTMLENYELDRKPLSLVFVGCSPLTRFVHTVTVRISVQPPELAYPWEIMRDFVQIIKKLIGLK